MKRVVERWVPIVVATSTGLISLTGYLLPQTMLPAFRDRLTEWAVVVAAFALILGLFNILQFHGQRVLHTGDGWFYSLVLILSAGVSWIPPMLHDPTSSVAQTLSQYIIKPLGGSLAALLVFTLTWSGVRLLRHRRNAWSVLFIVVVTLSLLGTTPLLGIEWLADIRDWLIRVPGMAGFRGLLLGVALGMLITGLRIFLGTERPHTES